MVAESALTLMGWRSAEDQEHPELADGQFRVGPGLGRLDGQAVELLDEALDTPDGAIVLQITVQGCGCRHGIDNLRQVDCLCQTDKLQRSAPAGFDEMGRSVFTGPGVGEPPLHSRGSSGR